MQSFRKMRIMIKCPSVPNSLCVGLKEEEESMDKSWSEAGLIIFGQGPRGTFSRGLTIQITL